MTTFPVTEAKANLSSLLARAEAGEEIIIARQDKPVVKLVLVENHAKPRAAGAWKGRFTLPESFFDPLPEEELQAWEGAYSFDDVK